MIKSFLRWWYTITGQKQEAEQLLCFALYAYVFDDGKGYELWQREFAHILDVFKEDKG